MVENVEEWGSSQACCHLARDLGFLAIQKTLALDAYHEVFFMKRT